MNGMDQAHQSRGRGTGRRIAIVIAVVALVGSLLASLVLLGAAMMPEGPPGQPEDYGTSARFVLDSSILLLAPPILALLALLSTWTRRWNAALIIVAMCVGYIVAIILIPAILQSMVTQPG